MLSVKSSKWKLCPSTKNIPRKVLYPRNGMCALYEKDGHHPPHVPFRLPDDVILLRVGNVWVWFSYNKFVYYLSLLGMYSWPGWPLEIQTLWYLWSSLPLLQALKIHLPNMSPKACFWHISWASGSAWPLPIVLHASTSLFFLQQRPDYVAEPANLL